MTINSGGWVSASEALRRASASVGDERQACLALRDLAKRGELGTQGIVDGQRAQLKPAFWNEWFDEDGYPAASENWREGQFLGRAGGTGIWAIDVEFSTLGFDEYFPTKDKSGSKRGRRPAHWWADAAVEIAVEIHENGLPERHEELLTRVLDRLAAKGHHPARSSLQPVVDELIARLRAG